MFTKGFRHDVELNLIQRDFIDAAGTVREASAKMGALLALWVMPVVFQPETRLGRFLGCSFHTPPRTLFFWLMPENEEQPLAPRRPGKKRVFRTPDGQALIASDFKLVSKFDRDLIVYCHGEQQVVVPSSGKKKERTEWVTQYDPDLPEPAGAISPGVESPVCKQCGLFEHDARHPFMAYSGPDRPLITVIFDGVTRAEDIVGELGTEGSPAVIRRIIKEASEETGVSVEDIRWVPMTRCTNWLKKVVNLKTHGNWCRHHVIDDLRRHPPVLVMPVGTAALGLLSHKSNAQEWSGRLLTYRGWPDDWLTNPKYALPRPDPRVEGRTVTGHPLFGPVPKTRIPMVPVQAPRLIFFAQNPVVYTRWSKSIVNAVRMAKEGVKALNYTRDYYHWTANVDSVEFALNEILQHPGLLVSYDTETTGLRPWAPDAAIVSMMFRWEDPATGKPRTVGFPWDYGPTPQYPDYELSPMRPHLERLKPLIWKVLTQSTLIGHNLTFDMLYTFATWWREHLVGWDDPALNAWRDRRLVALANASKFDTWHMAFAWQQKRGSLGLDALAYDWVPELAGYEEDMTLLINLHYDRMHPGANKGGHYLNCPVSQHKDYVVPYVMGDVEVCYRARAKILNKLETSDIYEFPLAHPDRPGKFRFFAPPSRHWVYHKIMSPASRVLMKMMARGLYIDEQALIEMETNMPKKIKQLREELSGVDPRIQAWCEQQAATETAPDGGKWVLDLENKGQLKDLLFKTLDLPVARLTKQGRKQLGEDIVAIKAKMSKAIADEKPDLADKPVELAKAVELQLREVAAVDKFTLNKLLVDHEFLRPLQDYRKLFKLYSTYVRPLRNLFSEGLDKKQRVADPHLCFDQCIHASFLMTGTRGGRLCVAGDTQLEVKVDGILKVVEISGLWRYNSQHVTVKTHNGRWQRIKCLYFKGYERMFEAITESGGTIKATAEHRVFSERGWQSLGVVAGQKLKLLVDLESHLGVGARRTEFSEACSPKADELSADERSDFEACCFTKLAGVSAFEGGIETPASSATGRRTEGQREWPEDAVSNVVEGAVGAKGGSRNTDRAHSEGNGDYAVFSRTEYSGAWVAEIGQCTGSDQNLDGISTKTDGSGMSGVDGGFYDLFHGQGEVFSQGVSGVHGFTTAGVVFEGHVPDAVYALEGGQGGHGGNFLVDESPRVGVVSGVDFIENSSFSGVRIQREQTSRFWVDGHEYFDRSGRGVSYGCSKQSEYEGSRAARLSGNALHNAPSSIQNVGGDDRNTGRFEAVIQWRSVGVQAVWDIEVEGDHSYLAQGLFHHNSCRNPNLQQLPRDGEVKQMFVSRFGERGCLYQGDLSQIELRLLAAACGDPTMVRAYFNEEDLHALTTSRIFNVPYEHFAKAHMEDLQSKGHVKEAKELDEKRSIGKTVNFLTGYGGGAFGLQNVLAMKGIYKKIEECEHIIEMFFDAYPALRDLLQRYKRFILDAHVAVSIFGRVRVFEEVRGDDEEAKAKALRAGCNHLIQATASDMMLIALFVIEDMMRVAGLESMVVSTVHDSLVIDCVRQELSEVHDIVMLVLNNFPDVFKVVFGQRYDTSWMIVPFTGDCDVGHEYFSMRKIPKKDIDWDKLLST